MGETIPRLISRKALIWLALAIAAAFFLPIFARRLSTFDWTMFRATFSSVNWNWMVASWILALSTYVGRVLRWQVMLAPQRHRSSFWGIFVATAIGFTAIVLFGRPGEIVRPYLIAKKEKVSFSSQLAAWFLERVFDLLIVLIIFGFALAYFEPPETVLSKGMQWVFHTGGKLVFALGVGCLGFLMAARWINPQRVENIAGKLPLPHLAHARILDLLHSFFAGMESCRSLTALGKLFFYTMFEWAIIIGCYICLFRSFPFTAHFAMLDVFVFLGFVAFGSIIQVPGIGGGMQVVATAVLKELFELPLEQASAVAISIWATTWVTIVPFGLLLAMKEGLEWRSLKHINTIDAKEESKETSNP